MYQVKNQRSTSPFGVLVKSRETPFLQEFQRDHLSIRRETFSRLASRSIPREMALLARANSHAYWSLADDRPVSATAVSVPWQSQDAFCEERWPKKLLNECHHTQQRESSTSSLDEPRVHQRPSTRTKGQVSTRFSRADHRCSLTNLYFELKEIIRIIFDDDQIIFLCNLNKHIISFEWVPSTRILYTVDVFLAF